MALAWEAVAGELGEEGVCLLGDLNTVKATVYRVHNIEALRVGHEPLAHLHAIGGEQVIEALAERG